MELWPRFKELEDFELGSSLPWERDRRGRGREGGKGELSTKTWVLGFFENSAF